MSSLGKDVILLNGEKVSIGDFSPSPLAVAMHLGRMPRFAGATNRPWYVLHHAMFCDEYFQYKAFNCEDDLEYALIRLKLLMHDAAEAVLGDCTAPFKLPEVGKLEDSLVGNLWQSWVGPVLEEAFDPAVLKLLLHKIDGYVHEVDISARKIEAWTAGAADKKDPIFQRIFGDRIEDVAWYGVINNLASYESINYDNPYTTELITDYVDRVEKLIKEITKLSKEEVVG